MDIVTIIVYLIGIVMAAMLGYALIKLIGVGVIFLLNILSGILKLFLLPLKIIAIILIYILFFNSPYRSLKIDDCKDTINYIPNLLLDLANWFEDIMNGDYSWFTIRFMFNEDAQRIYNESDYNYKSKKKNKKNKKKSNNNYSESNYESNYDYESDYESSHSYSNNSNSNDFNSNKPKSNNNEYDQQKAKHNKNLVEGELNRLYSRYNQIYRDNKLNLQRKNKLQYGIDERFSNLNRNGLNVDKRINEAIAIAYYLESNDLIKFRDEKIMYPNVMKNI